MNQVLSTEEILAIEHRGTKDEGLRFARAIEAAVLTKLDIAKPVAWCKVKDVFDDDSMLRQCGVKRGALLYTTPQPDRTAELEAALREVREALLLYTFDGNTADRAIATIDEVLGKPY